MSVGILAFSVFLPPHLGSTLGAILGAIAQRNKQPLADGAGFSVGAAGDLGVKHFIQWEHSFLKPLAYQTLTLQLGTAAIKRDAVTVRIKVATFFPNQLVCGALLYGGHDDGLPLLSVLALMFLVPALALLEQAQLVDGFHGGHLHTENVLC